MVGHRHTNTLSKETILLGSFAWTSADSVKRPEWQGERTCDTETVKQDIRVWLHIGGIREGLRFAVVVYQVCPIAWSLGSWDHNCARFKLSITEISSSVAFMLFHADAACKYLLVCCILISQLSMETGSRRASLTRVSMTEQCYVSTQRIGLNSSSKHTSRGWRVHTGAQWLGWRVVIQVCAFKIPLQWRGERPGARLT